MGKNRSSQNKQGTVPSSLNSGMITEEFSRLSDVQEEYSFIEGQLEGEPDDVYETRYSLSQSIISSINEVKRTMLKLRENPSDQGLYDEYKERENITLDFINAYFSFLRSSPYYGNAVDWSEPYTSIAFSPEVGHGEPVI